MSNTVYLSNKVIYLIKDSQDIRRLDVYDEIKKEVNKTSHMLAGSTDWNVVKIKCNQLAERLGLDLLLSCYYAVALTKTQGLRGLTDGLEVMIASLLISSHEPQSNGKKRGLLEWAIRHISKDIKLINPNYEQLRDLYKSEHLCEKMDRILFDRYAQGNGLLDNLACIIFEHIDHIEMNTSKLSEQASLVVISGQQQVVNERNYKLSVILFIFMALIFGYYAYYSVSIQSIFSPSHYVKDITYYQKSLSQSDRLKLEKYLNTDDQVNLASLGKTYVQQERNLKRLSQLFDNNERLSQLKQQWEIEADVANESVDKMVKRFELVRNKLSNLNMKIQSTKLSEIKNDVDSVTAVAQSLSPIYARVAYIESLIAADERQKAQEELSILNERLSALDLKAWMLEQQLTPEQ